LENAMDSPQIKPIYCDPISVKDITESESLVVLLHPIAIRIPNKYFVYSLSKSREQKKLHYKEFIEKYAGRARKIRVCFDETATPTSVLHKSVFVTAYGLGLDSWYIKIPTSSLQLE
jgi:hypothetical protein